MRQKTTKLRDPKKVAQALNRANQRDTARIKELVRQNKDLNAKGIFRFKTFYIDIPQKKMRYKICSHDQWVAWRKEDKKIMPESEKDKFKMPIVYMQHGATETHKKASIIYKKEYKKEYLSRPEIQEHIRKQKKLWRAKPGIRERQMALQKKYRENPEQKERVKAIFRDSAIRQKQKPEWKERHKIYQKKSREKNKSKYNGYMKYYQRRRRQQRLLQINQEILIASHDLQ